MSFFVWLKDADKSQWGGGVEVPKGMERFRIMEDVELQAEGKVPSAGEVFSVQRKAHASFDASETNTGHVEKTSKPSFSGKKNLDKHHKRSRKQNN